MGTGLSPFAILETNEGGTLRWSAKRMVRPRSSESHDLSFMDGIVFPCGDCLSIPTGEFKIPSKKSPIAVMQPVEDTRRERLKRLAQQEGGLANLCAKLSLSRKETSGLSRILNANIRHERGGVPYVMGSQMARDIEQKLGLQNGFMDTPLSYAELHNEEDPRALVMSLMEALPASEWSTVVRLVDALAQPDPKVANGQ